MEKEKRYEQYQPVTNREEEFLNRDNKKQSVTKRNLTKKKTKQKTQ